MRTGQLAAGASSRTLQRDRMSGRSGKKVIWLNCCASHWSHITGRGRKGEGGRASGWERGRGPRAGAGSRRRGGERQDVGTVRDECHLAELCCLTLITLQQEGGRAGGWGRGGVALPPGGGNSTWRALLDEGRCIVSPARIQLLPRLTLTYPE